MIPNWLATFLGLRHPKAVQTDTMVEALEAEWASHPHGAIVDLLTNLWCDAAEPDREILNDGYIWFAADLRDALNAGADQTEIERLLYRFAHHNMGFEDDPDLRRRTAQAIIALRELNPSS